MVEAESQSPWDTDEETLQWVCDEYMSPLSRSTLSAADMSPEFLQECASRLADTARMLRAVPDQMRTAMWPGLAAVLSETAASDYATIVRALTETGVVDALEVEDHAVLRQLEPSQVPSIDLEFLRAAGYRDPEFALRQLVRNARAVPPSLGSIGKVLDEGHMSIATTAGPAAPGPVSPKRKKWTGLAKLLTGAGLAGLNITSGVALTVGFGPLATGVTLPSVLASCATGVGSIIEGVGALRGE